MATVMPFQDKIDRNINQKFEEKAIRASFGDGYEQVAGRGIKPILNSVSLSILPLTVTQKTDYSDIEKKVIDYTDFMLKLDKL